MWGKALVTGLVLLLVGVLACGGGTQEDAPGANENRGAGEEEREYGWTHWDNLKYDDCTMAIKPPSETGREYYQVERVPCDGEWDLRVAASLRLEDGPYPGDTYIGDKLAELCPVMRSNEVIGPIEESWAEGNRVIACFYERWEYEEFIEKK